MIKNKNAIINVKFIFLPLVIIVFLFLCRIVCGVFKEKGAVCQPTLALSQEGGSSGQKFFARSRLNIDDREIGPGRFYTVQEKSLKAVPAANAESSLLRLKDYLKGLEEKNNSLKDKVELLTNLLNAKESELLELNEDYGNLKENLYRTIESQNKVKSELSQTSLSLQKELRKKEEENLALEKRLSNAEDELAAGSKQLKELDRAHELQIKMLNDQILQINLTAESAKNSILQLSGVLTKKEIEIGSKQKDVAKSAEELDKIKKELIEKEGALEVMRSKLKDLDSRNISASKALAAMKETNQVMSGQLLKATGDTTIKLEQANNEIESLKKELIAEKASRVDKQEQLSQRMVPKEQYQQLQKEAESLKKELEAERSLKEQGQKEFRESAETKTRLGDIESDLQKLNDELIAERLQAQRLRDQLEEQVVLNNSLKRKLKNIYTELELLRVEKSFEPQASKASPGALKKNTSPQGVNEKYNQSAVSGAGTYLGSDSETDNSVEVITDEKRKDALLLELDNFTAGD